MGRSGAKAALTGYGRWVRVTGVRREAAGYVLNNRKIAAGAEKYYDVVLYWGVYELSKA